MAISHSTDRDDPQRIPARTGRRIAAALQIACLMVYLSVAVSASAQRSHPFVPDSQRAVILAASKSLSMPGADADAYWTPTRAQVQRLEADLSRRPRANGYPLPAGLLDYYRQYVGVVIRHHRFIYVNGFKAVVLPEFSGGAKDWRHQPVFVSDGGNDFFHVTYDPRARRFYDFDFNGLG